MSKYIQRKKKIFISTPFSRKAVDRLEKFKVPAYKIGSGECNNYLLVEYVASKRKPIILSTGMNSIKTIKPATKILEKYNLNPGKDFIRVALVAQQEITKEALIKIRSLIEKQ